MREASERIRTERRRADRKQQPVATVYAPQEISVLTIPDDVRRHYAVEAYDVHFELDGSGAIKTVSSTVQLRALTPGVRFYFTGHAVDREPGTLAFEALAGAVLNTVQENEIGAVHVYFRLNRELHPDDTEPHTISYLVHVNATERSEPQIEYYTRPGTQQHTLQVQFTPPALPEKLWWFGEPDSLAASYPKPDQLLARSGSNYYRQEFSRLKPGWCYGFSWVWT
jgi:hypothetical protein